MRRNLRRPTCRTAPASRSTGMSRSPSAERLAVELHPALGQQPPRLAAGRAEVRRRAAPAGAPGRRVELARDSVDLLDLLGRPVLLVDPVELRPRPPPRRLGAVEALHDPPRQRALLPPPARQRRVELLAQQQLVVGRPSPRRARSSACRTSPRAGPSRPRSCRATCSCGARRRARAGSAS